MTLANVMPGIGGMGWFGEGKWMIIIQGVKLNIEALGMKKA
jgi:hypothetical protein